MQRRHRHVFPNGDLIRLGSATTVFDRPGKPFATVAVLEPTGWETEDIVARAVLRSPVFASLAASDPSAFPVPTAPARFLVQLHILLAAPPTAENGLALQRVLYEIYDLSTAMCWQLEAP